MEENTEIDLKKIAVSTRNRIDSTYDRNYCESSGSISHGVS
jgi:hypothetical protein